MCRAGSLSHLDRLRHRPAARQVLVHVADATLARRLAALDASGNGTDELRYSLIVSEVQLVQVRAGAAGRAGCAGPLPLPRSCCSPWPPHPHTRARALACLPATAARRTPPPPRAARTRR